jgi:hypothetical protein
MSLLNTFEVFLGFNRILKVKFTRLVQQQFSIAHRLVDLSHL